MTRSRLSRRLRLSYPRELAFWHEMAAEPGTPEREIRASRYRRIAGAYHAKYLAQGVSA